jgi:hypothetical protein
MRKCTAFLRRQKAEEVVEKETPVDCLRGYWIEIILTRHTYGLGETRGAMEWTGWR